MNTFRLWFVSISPFPITVMTTITAVAMMMFTMTPARSIITIVMTTFIPTCSTITMVFPTPTLTGTTTTVWMFLPTTRVPVTIVVSQFSDLVYAATSISISKVISIIHRIPSYIVLNLVDFMTVYAKVMLFDWTIILIKTHNFYQITRTYLVDAVIK